MRTNRYAFLIPVLSFSMRHLNSGLRRTISSRREEDQGSEAARSASVGYVSTGPPKLTRVAGQRASEFAPMVVGGPSARVGHR
jgi:hypothetical protein